MWLSAVKIINLLWVRPSCSKLKMLEAPHLFSAKYINTLDFFCAHRRRKRGFLFLHFLCGTGKNHKCTKLKGKIIIDVTLIWFEGTGKTIPLNSILEFSILSDFKMRNVIIWHWFIKNLVGTWRHYDVMCLLGICPPPLAPPPNILNLGPPNILNLSPHNSLNLPTPMVLED